jgi:hypothetical protein
VIAIFYKCIFLLLSSRKRHLHKKKRERKQTLKGYINRLREEVLDEVIHVTFSFFFFFLLLMRKGEKEKRQKIKAIDPELTLLQVTRPRTYVLRIKTNSFSVAGMRMQLFIK